MAHRPKPFFRNGRGWFIQLGKKQIKLADGPQSSESETAAWERYHEVMAENKSATPPPKTESISIAEVFDKFLDWCKKHRESRTYEWYRDHIQAFINHTGPLVKQPCADIKPFHVIEWVDSHDTWSPAYRRGAIIAIQRPFNWAEELGYIPASPIKRISKPQPQRREKFIRPDEWEKIKNHYAEGDPFRDLLEFAWETGCRPQEVKKIEPRHVSLEHHCVAFPPAEAKGKKRWRYILMTPHAEEIVRKHIDAHPDGVIFRNEDGMPWTKDAMNCRFTRLQKHLGIKYSGYDLRHGFCQDLLEKGNNTLAISELMGHSSTRMVDSVYSHMNQARGHLQKVLNSRTDQAKGR